MLYEQIQDAASYLRGKTNMQPATGIILGTGMSSLAGKIETELAIDYADIPHFPVSTVESHAGKLIFGRIAGTEVLAMAGRFHYYEGYSMQQVTFPVRVMKELGIRRIIMSNAAGSTNPLIEAGDLVFIRDHINLQPENPLRGPNDERLGPRFPDMLHTYDEAMLDKAEAIAMRHGIRAHRGVYVALQGPNLETPAEYGFLQRIGGDVVGMSTVPEVLVARHCGLQVFVLSVVSNKGYPPDQLRETTLEEVIAVVKSAESHIVKLVEELIREIAG